MEEPTTDQQSAAQASAPHPTGNEMLEYVGRQFIDSGLFSQSAADRTGEVVEKVHEVLGGKHLSKAVAIYEPGTGVEAIAILKPDGSVEPMSEEFFDDYRPHPKRRTGTAVFTRLESMVEHVNRFSSPESALFACDDMNNPRLTAVLDYNERVNETADTNGVTIHNPEAKPAFGMHRSTFAFPTSPEWKAWLKFNKQPMDNVEFAEFIEDRFVEIAYVDEHTVLHEDITKLIGAYGRAALGTPNAIFQLTEGLTIAENVVVGAHQKLANGAAQLTLKTEQTGAVNARGETVNVPGAFIIEIPIFAHGAPQQIAVRLRHRTTGGLKFYYELWGIERVFERAFTEACLGAANATGLPLFYGSPE